MSEVALIVERFRVAAAELASIIEDAAYGGFTPHIAAFVREEVSDALRPILKVLVALPESTRWPIPSREDVSLRELNATAEVLMREVNRLTAVSSRDIEAVVKDRLVWIDRALNRLDKASEALDKAAARASAAHSAAPTLGLEER